jgi:hypothetical protein
LRSFIESRPQWSESADPHPSVSVARVLKSPSREQKGHKLRSMSGNGRDFNNIETRAVIKFFFLQGNSPKEIDAIMTET